MAIVKTGYTRYESYGAFEQESAFGTALIDSTNFIAFEGINGAVPVFSPVQYLDKSVKPVGKNIIDIDDFYTNEYGQIHTVEIPEFIGATDVLAHMIYAVTQGSVAEGVSTPYVKTFTLNGAVNPDFSSNAGYFFTLLIKSPMASFSQKLTSCVMQNLNINFSSDNGGRATCSGTAISGVGYTGTSNPSGTNSISTVVAPNYNDSTAATLVINSLDMVWYSFNISIEASYAMVWQAGAAVNYVFGAGGNEGGLKVTATARVKYDSNSDTLLNSKGTDANATVFTLSDNTTVGYFKLNCDNTFIEEVTKNVGDEGELQTLDLSLNFANDYSATEYTTLEIADGIDQTW